MKVKTLKAYEYASDFEITLTDKDGRIRSLKLFCTKCHQQIRLHATSNLEGAVQGNIDEYINGNDNI